MLPPAFDITVDISADHQVTFITDENIFKKAWKNSVSVDICWHELHKYNRPVPVIELCYFFSMKCPYKQAYLIVSSHSARKQPLKPQTPLKHFTLNYGHNCSSSCENAGSL